MTPEEQVVEGTTQEPTAGEGPWEPDLSSVEAELAQIFGPASEGGEEGEGETPPEGTPATEESQRILAQIQQERSAVEKAVEEARKLGLQNRKSEERRQIERHLTDYLSGASETEKRFAKGIVDTDHGVDAYKASLKTLHDHSAQVDREVAAAREQTRIETARDIEARYGVPLAENDVIQKTEADEETRRLLDEGLAEADPHKLEAYLDRQLDGFAGHVSEARRR